MYGLFIMPPSVLSLRFMLRRRVDAIELWAKIRASRADFIVVFFLRDLVSKNRFKITAQDSYIRKISLSCEMFPAILFLQQVKLPANERRGHICASR